jgi:leader peptidase (prepilin peptidase)/N-methyltransferase
MDALWFDIATIFTLYPVVLYLNAAVLGLIVGSFLNVVIHRLPIMMEQEWREQCAELAGSGVKNSNSQPYNLIQPRSTCPHCGHKITAWENIPVISYAALRGRCSSCRSPISLQYPAIELLTALLSVWVTARFGLSTATIAALVLTWALIALSVIDFKHTLLPDDITLPFVWLGLLLSLGGFFTTPINSILGAAIGYVSLWLIFHIFKWITGKEGMGYGDFKLFAVFGAWLGWQVLPGVILLSSLVGAIVGITLIAFTGRDRQLPMPFGPFLAVAGWFYLLYGDSINNLYMNWLKL